MTHNNYIYIAVMALVSYTIRILPLTLIRKPIKNRFIQSFLYYVPYVTLARCKLVSGIGDLLCRSVRAGTVPLKLLCPEASCRRAFCVGFIFSKRKER